MQDACVLQGVCWCCKSRRCILRTVLQSYLGVNSLGQVRADLCQSTLLQDLVAEVEQVQCLIDTVCVEGVAPELLLAGSRYAWRETQVRSPSVLRQGVLTAHSAADGSSM